MSQSLLIHGANVVLPDGIEQVDIRLENGRISDIGHQLPTAEQTISGEGNYLSAGWLDLQCNGGFGLDFTADPQTIWAAAEQMPRFGVTGFLPTIITAPLHVTTQAQAVLTKRPSRLGVCTEPLGLHIEGPYLNKEKKGAHNPSYIREPNATEVSNWGRDNGIWLVTLAPERDGAAQMIADLTARGVVVSAGHSMATFDEATAGFEQGVRYGTHLFNAMPQIHHREPGLVGALLHDNRPTVGIIPDGVHVHPALVQSVWQTAGSRINVVTDAMAAMGLGAGSYLLGDHEVTVDETSARLENGTLAGSIITLDAAVRNFWHWSGCTLPEALATVTSTPADLLNLPNKGRIATGLDADLVLFNENLEVKMTLIDGQIAYDQRN